MRFRFSGVNNLKHGTQHDAILSKFVEYNVWNKNNIFCEFGSGKVRRGLIFCCFLLTNIFCTLGNAVLFNS
jgi:hypothetical protein